MERINICKKIFNEQNHDSRIEFCFDEDKNIGFIKTKSIFNKSDRNITVYDTKPVNLDFIYDILEKINNEIPYALRRKIKKECIEVTTSRVDFQNEVIYYMIININFDKMFNILNENNY